MPTECRTRIKPSGRSLARGSIHSPSYHGVVIEVRRVRPEEYADAGIVTASAWEPEDSPDEQRWLSFQSRIADVAGRDGVAIVYVATEDDHILGSVTLEMKDRVGANQTPLATDEAHVRVLAVAPASRRKGVGQLLMSHCAVVARQNGKARLTLNTSVKNTSAQIFYEAIGYVRVSNLTLPDDSQLCSYEKSL